MFRGHLRGISLGVGHLQFTATGQRTGAHDHVDLVLFQKVPYPLVELRGDATRTLNDIFDVEGHVLDRQSEFLRMVDQVLNFGRSQKSLGRNTPPVQTDTAEMFTFHDSYFHADLRGTDGGYIAAGTTPDHDQVVLIVSQRISFPNGQGWPIFSIRRQLQRYIRNFTEKL